MNSLSINTPQCHHKEFSIHIFLGDISARGGIERVSVSLANALAERYEVKIISLYKENSDLFFKPETSIKIHEL